MILSLRFVESLLGNRNRTISERLFKWCANVNDKMSIYSQLTVDSIQKYWHSRAGRLDDEIDKDSKKTNRKKNRDRHFFCATTQLFE